MCKDAYIKETSEHLRAVAFFCAALVVSVHCWSPSTWFAGTSGLSVCEAAVAFLFTDTLSRCAVPCFFVLSGFFLALKYEPTASWYWTLLRKRFVTLYVPFVIWNVLYLVRNSVLARTNLFTLSGIFGYDLFSGPGFHLFWYIQVILVAVLASPLWLPVIRSRIGAMLSTSLLSLAYLTGNFGHWLSLQLSASNFLWIFVGATAAFRLASLSRPRKSVRIAAAGLLVLAMVAHVVTGCEGLRTVFVWSDRVVVVTGVFTVFANAALIHRALARFAPVYSLAFFVYAMHPQGLLVHIPLERLGAPFLVVYFVRIVCGVAVPVLLGLAMRRFTPCLLALLTGNRAR